MGHITLDADSDCVVRLYASAPDNDTSRTDDVIRISPVVQISLFSIADDNTQQQIQPQNPVRICLWAIHHPKQTENMYLAFFKDGSWKRISRIVLEKEETIQTRKGSDDSFKDEILACAFTPHFTNFAILLGGGGDDSNSARSINLSSENGGGNSKNDGARSSLEHSNSFSLTPIAIVSIALLGCSVVVIIVICSVYHRVLSKRRDSSRKKIMRNIANKTQYSSSVIDPNISCSIRNNEETLL